jgi:hypothetical protein
MSDIEIVEEQEFVYSFDNKFLLIYNMTNDVWEIEFLEEDDDDLWQFETAEDLIGLEIKGVTFTQELIDDFKSMVEKELAE